jgi:ATP-dependent exoDNAse (exonuclease V) alpha subunit
MCVPGCGGTGKSQLIRAITNYFQMTKRGKMLGKLAPTSIAAGEIDGLTIHSFLGESRKTSRKKERKTFRPGDTKLENEWRHVKYLIIDEMSMVGLSLLARLNRIVKTAKHINTDAPFGGVNVIFFGDYLQYSPVLDRPLYYNFTSAQQYTDREIEIQCAQKVISQINCVVQLDQQMRTEDKRYLELLDRLRLGKSTMDDYQLLCTRIVGSPNLKASLQQDPWKEVCSISYFLTFANILCHRPLYSFFEIHFGLKSIIELY